MSGLIETTATPERQFQVIRNDGIINVDAERFVPGKVVARFEDADHIAIFYRYGTHYAKRVIYRNNMRAAENLKSWIHEAQEVNRAEWAHLQWTAGKDSGAELQEDPPEKDACVPSEEDRRIYGHAWSAKEFLKEFTGLVKEGDRLIAYDSTRGSPYNKESENQKAPWEHSALFRTEETSALGNVLFRYVGVQEDRPNRWEQRISKQTAVSKYKLMKTKVCEMGPLTVAREGTP